MDKATTPTPEKKPQKNEVVIPESVLNDLHEIMRRLRLLEERYSGLRKKTQFSEQSMLKDVKDLNEDISTMTETIAELRNEISDLSEKMSKLTDEIRNAVKKSEFNVLVKYMDYWQPMNFLTKREAESLLADLKEKL